LARSRRRQKRTPGQTGARSNSSARRLASDPISRTAERPSNKYDVAVSCPHSIFAKRLECCADQLSPPRKAVVRIIVDFECPPFSPCCWRGGSPAGPSQFRLLTQGRDSESLEPNLFSVFRRLCAEAAGWRASPASLGRASMPEFRIARRHFDFHVAREPDYIAARRA
jgi:hypothetical protein